MSKFFWRKKSSDEQKPTPTHGEDEEYVVPALRAIPVQMTEELACRRREEQLRKEYGALKEKAGEIV